MKCAIAMEANETGFQIVKSKCLVDAGGHFRLEWLRMHGVKRAIAVPKLVFVETVLNGIWPVVLTTSPARTCPDVRIGHMVDRHRTIHVGHIFIAGLGFLHKSRPIRIRNEQVEQRHPCSDLVVIDIIGFGRRRIVFVWEASGYPPSIILSMHAIMDKRPRWLGG